MNENRKIQETQEREDRFAYMNQKPKYSRKSLVALGVASAMVLALVIGGACVVAKTAFDAVKESDLFQMTEGTPEVEAVPEEQKFLTAEIIPTIETPEESEPEEYTEKRIVLTLYDEPKSDHVVVTTSADEEHAGYYVLYPDSVYSICWDADPLYRNEEGKVDAEITISSDFLIGGGIDGEGMITVRIRDYNRHVDYVGELPVASGRGNLGIEFCADRCQRYAYGSNPEIAKGEFTVCFYTSGKYVESKTSDISSVDGYYRYTYGTDGSEALNDVVTQRISVPTPMPNPTPAQSAPLAPPTETPKKDPGAKDPSVPADNSDDNRSSTDLGGTTDVGGTNQ